jgi:putative alpha-1,2-mannosidase
LKSLFPQTNSFISQCPARLAITACSTSAGCTYGKSTAKTYLPESLLAGGGELAFSLAAKPNKTSCASRCYSRHHLGG